MATKLLQLYNYAMEEGSDPRVQKLFLMGSPFPTVFIVLIYLFTVKVIGPNLMKNRKPFDLKKVLVIYNALQVLLSSYLFYLSFLAAYKNGYSVFRCHDVNFNSKDANAMLPIYAMYYYFLSKFTEFFDTIFFILRKKTSQITFLHLFHHSQVPIFVWICVKFMPGGSIVLGTAENSLVHVIMYFYYFLAGMGPNMQKYLWWKRYLTTIQLLQFIAALIHMSLILFGTCYTLYKPFVVSGLLNEQLTESMILHSI